MLNDGGVRNQGMTHSFTLSGHTCERPTGCWCYLLATEPAEDCPIHGSGEWPPRCVWCGRFMRYLPDKDRVTESVLMHVIRAGEMDEFTERMIGPHGLYSRISDAGLSLVEAHKKVYGEQSYCVIGGRCRYWVWDLYPEWRVYVSNYKGISIEVQPEITAEGLMLILREYWRTFDDF